MELIGPIYYTDVTTQRLYKKEKLCSLTAIELLFAPGGADGTVMAYPWRAVWRGRSESDRRPACPQFLISVPKRRLRHAVDRVRMRRLMREAYRLHRHLLPDPAPALDIAFIYVASELTDYKASVRSIHKILGRISAVHTVSE